jgi:hypothetical protein
MTIRTLASSVPGVEATGCRQSPADVRGPSYRARRQRNLADFFSPGATAMAANIKSSAQINKSRTGKETT